VENERVQWNESGHARLRSPAKLSTTRDLLQTGLARVGGTLEDARATVAARLAELGDDWADHIAIL
jgi:hypothetical protein